MRSGILFLFISFIRDKIDYLFLLRMYDIDTWNTILLKNHNRYTFIWRFFATTNPKHPAKIDYFAKFIYCQLLNAICFESGLGILPFLPFVKKIKKLNPSKYRAKFTEEVALVMTALCISK